MGDLPSGIRLKLERGHEHFQALEGLLRSWERPQPHRVFTEPDENSDAELQRFRYVIQIIRPLPSDELSKALGDCINNYRCVLDHLIWQHSIVATGLNPPKPMGIKFPASGTSGLHAVPPSVVAAVQGLQGHRAGDDPAIPPPLRMLIELSNADKHRAIHAVHHFVRNVNVSVVPHIIGTTVENAQPTPLKGDAIVLARIAIPRPRWRGEAVDMKCRTEHGVAIAETARTPLAHLGLTLTAIRQRVEEAVDTLGDLLP